MGRIWIDWDGGKNIRPGDFRAPEKKRHNMRHLRREKVHIGDKGIISQEGHIFSRVFGVYNLMTFRKGRCLK